MAKVELTGALQTAQRHCNLPVPKTLVRELFDFFAIFPIFLLTARETADTHNPIAHMVHMDGGDHTSSQLWSVAGPCA